MKRQLIITALTILSLKSYAQIKFEKGYFIDNQGEKTECLIKNTDWKNNPVAFEYKLTEDSETNKALIEEVKEFSISNISKYQRFTVDVDRSTENLNKLSKDKEPEFSRETLFLKLLVEGKANLYLYEEGNMRRYFYREKDSVIPLIYKLYRAPGNKLGKNHEYRRQLWNKLKCGDVSMKRFERIGYTKKELIAYFVEYNQCEDTGFTNYEAKQKRKVFNLYLRPGINISSLSVRNVNTEEKDADFGPERSFRMGIEAEFILPFNRNKWSVIAEPTYQYFTSETALNTQKVTTDYKSIEIPLGARYYFFLNDRSKAFVNVSYVLDFNMNAFIDYEKSPDLKIRAVPNFAFGAGYNYNDRYTVEVRYGTGRDLFASYTTWYSKYNTFSIILGYNIFKK